jgi:catechol 2,3-dioxygenase-like lactoylglutathione lyase family enzyme/predicted enzyme related to lactoylglutathione lyase
MPNRQPQKRAPLSSRAKRGICFWGLLTALFVTAPNSAQTPPKRPRIFGIANVHILVSDFCRAQDFYAVVLGQSISCEKGQNPTGGALFVNRNQFVALTTRSSHESNNLIAGIALATSDVAGLRRYLTFQKVTFEAFEDPAGSIVVAIDPEGHRVSFVQWSNDLWKEASSHASSPSLIHAGFIVHNRAATEHFYKDILGFRPYWHGGMKDDQTDWVSMQVPDGTDWLEFMVNVEPDADQKLRGIMNHIAIGVTDIHDEEKKLKDAGVKLAEEPQIGRDGKWQLNLYDPDFTRVEFMEFTPVQKPCCSEFTGPHPGPQSRSKAPAKP